MNKQEYDWNESKLLTDEYYEEKDTEKFKDLLNKEPEKPVNAIIKGREIIKGKIVGITKNFVIVDVGLKSEGLIPRAEFANVDEIVLDNEVEVFLEKVEGAYGQIILSRDKAYKLRQWEHIIANYSEGDCLDGKIIRKVKGGLIVDVGVEAFLPGSQIDNKKIFNIDEFIGRKSLFKILKINIERKNIVVSRREVLEAELASKKIKLLETIQVGDLRKGMVKNITDFGAFLDIDGIDGLLHITDMTWKRIRHPSELVKIGDDLEIIVLGIDREKSRLTLGLKQKEPNPLEEIEQKYPVGTTIKGKIVNLVSYGAFLEIEKGVEGLIHISEMSWTKNITDPNEVVSVGDEIEAVVLHIQKEEGKLSLGMKQTQKNPWDDVINKYAIGSTIQVEIQNLTNYGAFVELEPGIDGLIHISDISWIKKVSHPSEVLNKGDKVDAVILSVDKDSKKITLGIKQLTNNPWSSIEKTMPIGSLVKGKVVKIVAFGIFVELENGIEALIHVNDLSDQPFGKVEDVVSMDDVITAKVIKLDSEHKKISLSIKDYLIDSNQENRDDIIVGSKKKEDKKGS